MANRPTAFAEEPFGFPLASQCVAMRAPSGSAAQPHRPIASMTPMMSKLMTNGVRLFISPFSCLLAACAGDVHQCCQRFFEHAQIDPVDDRGPLPFGGDEFGGLQHREM